MEKTVTVKKNTFAQVTVSKKILKNLTEQNFFVCF